MAYQLGHQMVRAVIALLLSTTLVRGELVFTAAVAPTQGLAGFDTYQITATSDLGNIVCFDFSRAASRGVSGAINQASPYGQPTIFENRVFGDYEPMQDTQFLFDRNDLLVLFPEESATDLHAAFTLIGDRQLTIGNSVPFLQVTTSLASDVLIAGSLVVRRPNNEYVSFDFNLTLAEISIGPPPVLEVLPSPVPDLTSVEPANVPPPAEPANPIVEPLPETGHNYIEPTNQEVPTTEPYVAVSSAVEAIDPPPWLRTTSHRASRIGGYVISIMPSVLVPYVIRGDALLDPTNIFAAEDFGAISASASYFDENGAARLYSNSFEPSASASAAIADFGNAVGMFENAPEPALIVQFLLVGYCLSLRRTIRP